MKRRDFLKTLSLAFAPLIVSQVRIFAPPRAPFVQMNRQALDGLYAHLGVLPSTNELSICEGHILDMENWDGTGYPCLVENACCFGADRPRVWIYDFDLWNFRDDDNVLMRGTDLLKRGMTFWDQLRPYNSHAAHYAARRFGSGASDVVKAGGGWLSNDEAFGGRKRSLNHAAQCEGAREAIADGLRAHL